MLLYVQTGCILAFENLLNDWKVIMNKQSSFNKDCNMYCMTFRLKRVPDSNTGPYYTDYWCTYYAEIPEETADDLFEFKIHMHITEHLVVGEEDDHHDPNPDYAIVAVEYQDGNRIPWDQFLGTEIDAIITETIPRMYQSLYVKPSPILNFKIFQNMPGMAVTVFNQHLERVTRQRNKKYNAALYRKVALCMPAGLPKEMVLKIAAFGFLKPFDSVEMYNLDV